MRKLRNNCRVSEAYREGRPPGFAPEAQNHRLWWLLSLEIGCRLQTIRHAVDISEQQCFEVIQLAFRVLRVVEQLSETHVLRYMQDAAASLLSSFASQMISVGVCLLIVLRESTNNIDPTSVTTLLEA